MSDRRDLWRSRYRSVESFPAPPGALLCNQDLLPTRGAALDLACGLGSGALWLADRGLDTWAWDWAEPAIATLTQRAAAQGLALRAEVRDLVAVPPEPGRFDLILISRFLHRALIPAIAAALRPGGWLLHQTFTATAPADRRPASPSHVLKPGELIELWVPPLEGVRHHEPTTVSKGHATESEAWLLAQRPEGTSTKSSD